MNMDGTALSNAWWCFSPALRYEMGWSPGNRGADGLLTSIGVAGIPATLVIIVIPPWLSEEAYVIGVSYTWVEQIS